jgi:hypothetical protein
MASGSLESGFFVAEISRRIRGKEQNLNWKQHHLIMKANSLVAEPLW